MLIEKLKEKNVILASSSPRRQELLRGCGIGFEVVRYTADESYPATMDTHDVALYVARRKADAWPGVLSGGDILITADTVVIAHGVIMGKPSDRDEAINMLRGLSGAEHEVVTGVSIRTDGGSREFSELSKVRFRELTVDEVEYYVDRFQPYDKAGAYGIQEWIGLVAISSIKGSYYNVMGLPTERLYRELAML